MLTPGRSVATAAILVLLAVTTQACGGLGAATPSPSATRAPVATASTAGPAPVAAAPTAPGPAGTATPENRPDVERLVKHHLGSLQRIADEHGGDRLSGSDGFQAASTYVAEVLEGAGYRVERRAFNVDGVAGTNVLVERGGASGDVIMLGAHLDTVAGSPGMNDNASGVAAVLAVAETLAALPAPHHTVRVALWDAEEGGPIGSRAYVASLSPDERARIRGYLNLDMIGSPNPLRLVYDEAGAAPGSDAITARFAAVLDDAGLAWEPIDLEGDSDHGPFIAAGIPTGGLFSGGIEPVSDTQAARFGATAGVPADACSHRPCDTIDNVDPAGAAELARVVAAVLAELAADEAD